MTAAEFHKRMKGFELYFSKNSSNHESLRPEHDAVQMMNAILLNGNELKREDVEAILKIYNRVVRSVHCDGSGWLDYSLHLRGHLLSKGFQVMKNEDGTMMLED